jgi:hypothetical protein
MFFPSRLYISSQLFCLVGEGWVGDKVLGEKEGVAGAVKLDQQQQQLRGFRHQLLQPERNFSKTKRYHQFNSQQQQQQPYLKGV